MVSSSLSLIGGVHIGATELTDIKLIRYVLAISLARPSKGGGGGCAADRYRGPTELDQLFRS